jgi:hypothetical protein
LMTVRLRVLLTSRPEIPIQYGFNQMQEIELRDLVLHNISPSIVDHDISIFLEHNLRLIAQEQCLQAGWPGADTTAILVQKSSGLFIWAATACRFVREGLFAEERINTLLDGSNDSNTPEEQLNIIYITVLRSSIANYTEKEKQMLYSILNILLGSIAVLFSTLSVGSLSRLVSLPKQRVDRTLRNLHAILDIPKDESRPLSLHHPSFRDFVLKRERCSDSNFWVDEQKAHQRLADSCIQLMLSSLKEDIYGISTPGTLVSEVDSSQVQQYLPLEVQYACLYWIQHLQRSGAQLQDNDYVHQFLRSHFLHWLEALSWMQKISEGILEIISLESITIVSLLMVYHG